MHRAALTPGRATFCSAAPWESARQRVPMGRPGAAGRIWSHGGSLAIYWEPPMEARRKDEKGAKAHPAYVFQPGRD